MSNYKKKLSLIVTSELPFGVLKFNSINACIVHFPYTRSLLNTLHALSHSVLIKSCNIGSPVLQNSLKIWRSEANCPKSCR